MPKFIDIRYVVTTSIFMVFFATTLANLFLDWQGGNRYRLLLRNPQDLIATTGFDERQELTIHPNIRSGNNPVFTDFGFDNQELGVVFQDIGWNRHLVADSLFIAMPSDIGKIEPVSRRKRLFLGIIMPVVIRSLEKVLRTRTFLLEALGETLSNGEKQRVDGLCRIYRVKSNCGVESLLPRVDVLPVSLIFAQAAIESGWGSSRFAQEGNALFGQWTTAQGKGLVPERRDEGRSHKIKSYVSLEASVDSYLRNLNGHPVYRELRRARREFRETNKTSQGDYLQDPDIVWKLLPHLGAYSEKGEQYINLLTDVIRDNELIRLDRLLSDFVG